MYCVGRKDGGSYLIGASFRGTGKPPEIQKTSLHERFAALRGFAASRHRAMPYYLIGYPLLYVAGSVPGQDLLLLPMQIFFFGKLDISAHHRIVCERLRRFGSFHLSA